MAIVAHIIFSDAGDENVLLDSLFKVNNLDAFNNDLSI
jgi:hypothetical protein